MEDGGEKHAAIIVSLASVVPTTCLQAGIYMHHTRLSAEVAANTFAVSQSLIRLTLPLRPRANPGKSPGNTMYDGHCKLNLFSFEPADESPGVVNQMQEVGCKLPYSLDFLSFFC